MGLAGAGWTFELRAGCAAWRGLRGASSASGGRARPRIASRGCRAVFASILQTLACLRRSKVPCRSSVRLLRARSYSLLSFVELHHLDLSGDISAPNDFQKGGMAEFVERSSFQCLQSLNMSYCLLGKGGSEAFARSRVFSSLETLTLRGCQLGREDVEVLACYGHFPLLKTLDLSENKHR